MGQEARFSSNAEHGAGFWRRAVLECKVEFIFYCSCALHKGKTKPIGQEGVFVCSACVLEVRNGRKKGRL